MTIYLPYVNAQCAYRPAGAGLSRMFKVMVHCLMVHCRLVKCRGKAPTVAGCSGPPARSSVRCATQANGPHADGDAAQRSACGDGERPTSSISPQGRAWKCSMPQRESRLRTPWVRSRPRPDVGLWQPLTTRKWMYNPRHRTRQRPRQLSATIRHSRNRRLENRKWKPRTLAQPPER